MALLCAALAGCAVHRPVSPKPQTVSVFAAASLTGAFTELGTDFENANPGVNLILNFASSNLLGRQIETGARVDVFASADAEEMQALVDTGLVSQNAPRTFLTNRLTVVLPASNPADVLALEDLARPGLKVVLASEDVPIGRYTRQFLERASAALGSDFPGRVLDNVVSYEDNVRQVVAKVQLGEADAGVVYISDAVAAPELRTIEIPPAFNVTAEYPIAPLAGAAEAEMSARFIEYILSPAGQATLTKWGFGPRP